MAGGARMENGVVSVLVSRVAVSRPERNAAPALLLTGWAAANFPSGARVKLAFVRPVSVLRVAAGRAWPRRGMQLGVATVVRALVEVAAL